MAPNYHGPAPQLPSGILVALRFTNRRLHVSPATTRGANVPKAALVHGLVEDAYVSQHVALIRPVDSGVFAATYLWIVSPANGRRQLERWTYGDGKPGLNLEQLRLLTIVLLTLTRHGEKM